MSSLSKRASGIASELAVAHQTRATLRTELSIAQQEVSAVRSSLSWKITGPLRLVARPFIKTPQESNPKVRALSSSNSTSNEEATPSPSKTSDGFTVSIIIPAYNQWEMTANCIESIYRNVSIQNYEIILADDQSSDETVNALDYYPNLVIARTDENEGFLGNCNNAAKKASGDYLIFLNNDTEVHVDWLESLIQTFEADPLVAIVGSKLVYPDGTLQEAGGIIWQDASGWNFGRNQNPDASEYCYVKDVDYVSGASIAVREKFWSEVGGFDDRYAPAYYEDTDLAFSARDLGYRVLLQPKSLVTHFEGKSHGTDETSGIKAYQAINNQKFRDKWQSTLENNHFPNAECVFLARDRSAGKPCILVIDHYVPWFDKDAGSRSTFMYLQFLVAHGCNVKFIPDNFYPHQPYLDTLQQMGIEVLIGNYYAEHWEDWLEANGQFFDVVFMHRPHISIKYLSAIKDHCQNAKIIYQCHDLHFLRLGRMADLYQDEKYRAEATHWKEIEFDLMTSADVALTFSAHEKNLLGSLLPNASVEHVPLFLYEGVAEQRNRLREGREHIMFVGGFQHTPNVDGIMWFVNEVYPLVLATFPHIKLKIVGSNPPDEISALSNDSISVLGYVSDFELDELYNRALVNILPLRVGAGVKGKLVESMQKCCPVVSTPVGLEGVSADQFGLQGFDTPKDFSNEVCRLIKDERHWSEVRDNMVKCFKAQFSLDAARDQLIDLFMR